MATAAQTTNLAPGEYTLIQPGQRLFTAADLAAMPEPCDEIIPGFRLPLAGLFRP